jgi:ribosomal protein S18 acetylase RimI-like enzyme
LLGGLDRVAHAPIVSGNRLASLAGVGEAGAVIDGPALRSVTVDDVSAVFELVTLCEIAETGEAWCTMDELDAEFADDTTRSVAIDDPRGGLTAYAWLTPSPQRRIATGGFFIRPGGDWSVAPALVGWLRRGATELGEDVSVHCFASTANPAMCRLYESAGGKVVRRYYRMGIEVDAGFDPPSPPEGVVVRGVTDDADLRATHRVIESAFADQFAHEPRSYEDWRRREADGTCPDRGLWWLALVDGSPVAGLYGSATAAGGYVDRLATLREFRGRGLGTLLLRTAFAEFGRRGMVKTSLSVDAANSTGAVGLYRSVGMSIEHEEVRYELLPLAR